MKKDKSFYIRVTKREHEAILKKAKNTGNSITELLVKGALNAVMHDREVLKEFIQVKRKFSKEYGQIGNNVNQITTAFNILIKTNSKLIQSDLDKMISIFEDLKSHHEQLLSELRRIQK